ncbi:MAG: arginine transporter [Pseudomonadota bacterium]
MRFILLGILIVGLAACGGRASPPAGVQFASGPISRACIDADRRAATTQLCQCVQAVANDTLSSREQARAARFFADPQQAQDTRQSDNVALERFWTRYRAFADRAETICRAVT